ncbi:hypothetical protein KSMBR1_1658 [Candidatus Kuenenia stuttgartiensis]|uniref:Uncharacterized protein n=2 Tax=Candidatus Brocadiaceae TaxID=1127830 RepID=A0A2C9CHD1_KUEST|nr:hypothetical protein KSMBR1_1658 [Candidatus Kuenenia stuttgartiensis]
MSDPREWGFVADMNCSGSTTISDVWLWFKWLCFYPGDYLLYYLIHSRPEFAAFLEITCNNYGGVFSGIVVFVIIMAIRYPIDRYTNYHKKQITENQNVDCYYCKEKIKQNAKICFHCGHYQKKRIQWFNQYINHVATFISIFLLVVAYWQYNEAKKEREDAKKALEHA